MQKKKSAVQEIINIIFEHVMTVKKTDQQDEIINQIFLSNFYLKTIQHSKYEIK